MPSSTAKRIVLHRFDRQPVEAFVSPASYLLAEGVELITTTGALQLLRYQDVKALCFGAESASSDLFHVHNLFERRPKGAGLWTRFTFRDGDQLEGILPHNLLEWPEAGYIMAPPHASAARQRVFVPRAALSATELRGVMGASSAQRAVPASKTPGRQLTIFD